MACLLGPFFILSCALQAGLLLLAVAPGIRAESNVSLRGAGSNSLLDQQVDYEFAPKNDSFLSENTRLKDSMSFMGKNGTDTLALLRRLLSNGTDHNIDPARARSSLAYLLKLGNGTLNARTIATALNRTARGDDYGGGYGGQCCGG